MRGRILGAGVLVGRLEGHGMKAVRCMRLEMIWKRHDDCIGVQLGHWMGLRTCLSIGHASGGREIFLANWHSLLLLIDPEEVHDIVCWPKSSLCAPVLCICSFVSFKLAFS